MNIKDLIITKYKSIDNFIEETDVQLGRTYLYRLVNDETVNPSLAVVEELARVLEKNVDDIIKAIYSTRHRD